MSSVLPFSNYKALCLNLSLVLSFPLQEVFDEIYQKVKAKIYLDSKSHFSIDRLCVIRRISYCLRTLIFPSEELG